MRAGVILCGRTCIKTGRPELARLTSGGSRRPIGAKARLATRRASRRLGDRLECAMAHQAATRRASRRLGDRSSASSARRLIRPQLTCKPMTRGPHRVPRVRDGSSGRNKTCKPTTRRSPRAPRVRDSSSGRNKTCKPTTRRPPRAPRVRDGSSGRNKTCKPTTWGPTLK